jgi:hypothetical protein
VVCKGYTPPPGFRPDSLRALLAGAAVQHQQQQQQQVRGGDWVNGWVGAPRGRGGRSEQLRVLLVAPAQHHQQQQLVKGETGYCLSRVWPEAKARQANVTEGAAGMHGTAVPAAATAGEGHTRAWAVVPEGGGGRGSDCCVHCWRVLLECCAAPISSALSDFRLPRLPLAVHCARCWRVLHSSIPAAVGHPQCVARMAVSS